MSRYLVLGAGFQGRACAYDLSRSPGVTQVALADASPQALASAGAFLRKAARGARVRLLRLDAARPAEIERAAREVDAVVSCVPYFLNLPLAEAAVRAGTHFVDLGGSTDIVRRELALHARAKRAGVCVRPDNGLGPGMISTLAVAAMNRLDRADEVRIYDGGLPQNPVPPLNYMLTFSEHGLINEYAGTAVALVGGRVVRRPALSDLETVEVPLLGRLEAGHAAGGLSTLAETYAGRVRTMYNKFLRYPGHIPAMEAMREMGFFDETPLTLRPGVRFAPRELAAKLFRRHFERPGERDLVVIQVVARGVKDGAPAEVVCDMLDRYDPKTAMTAMMRTTAFPASIVAQLAAGGRLEPGAFPVETGVPPDLFLAEAAKRGFKPKWTLRRPALKPRAKA